MKDIPITIDMEKAGQEVFGNRVLSHNNERYASATALEVFRAMVSAAPEPSSQDLVRELCRRGHIVKLEPDLPPVDGIKLGVEERNAMLDGTWVNGEPHYPDYSAVAFNTLRWDADAQDTVMESTRPDLVGKSALYMVSRLTSCWRMEHYEVAKAWVEYRAQGIATGTTYVDLHNPAFGGQEGRLRVKLVENGDLVPGTAMLLSGEALNKNTRIKPKPEPKESLVGKFAWVNGRSPDGNPCLVRGEITDVNPFFDPWDGYVAEVHVRECGNHHANVHRNLKLKVDQNDNIKPGEAGLA